MAHQNSNDPSPDGGVDAAASILILGMSHTIAIGRAVKEDEQDFVTVVNLRQEAAIFNAKRWSIEPSKISVQKPSHVFLSVGGNTHNVFGLIENPVPFRLGHKTHGAVPDDDTRVFVPHDVLYAYFEDRLSRALRVTDVLCEHFKAAKPCFLCAPPPIESDEFILANPGYFKDQVNNGLTPPDLRLALYQIQSEIYRRHCEGAGIPFVSPPQEAVDAAGFLDREYYGDDPTHGNVDYGRLVLEQVFARVGGAE